MWYFRAMPSTGRPSLPLDRLRGRIGRFRRVVVAYSGGVDSALVYAVAREVLGDAAVAVTAVSPSLARAELEAARETAARIGGRHVLIDSGEVQDERYRENTPLRCYFCKTEVYGLLTAWAREHGYEAVLDGTNLDDTRDPRPGRKAAREHGVTTPLLDAGFTKEEVRAAARELGLPVWDKPAMACLSSRIPYGTRVTPELLARVEAAEEVLRRAGLSRSRLRHHGEVARIEVEPDEIPRVIEARESIAAQVRALGYTWVALDLDGYRMGSMNEARGEPRRADEHGSHAPAFHPE